MTKKTLIRKTIAVIFGGTSAEREISLISGRAVVQAIKQLPEFRVLEYDPKTDLEKLVKDKDQIDLAFPVLHGRGGEDGTIQGFLELLGIPYVGSGVKASALAIDKIASKALFQAFNLPVLPHQEVLKGESVKIELDFPVIVKPNSAGSSLGVTIIKGRSELAPALKKAFEYDEQVLIEPYIRAREITVPVLGQGQKAMPFGRQGRLSGRQAQALPVIEIIPTQAEFFDYEVKYDGSTKEIVPAQIAPNLASKAQELALKAHQILGCKGVTRTDMLLKDSQFCLLEINTIPGMTAESLVPKSARAAGMEFGQLIERLIKEA